MNKLINAVYKTYETGCSGKWPTPIRDLLNSYNDKQNKRYTLDLDLLPEFYYGDPINCLAVLLTHNPGRSNPKSKGRYSNFGLKIFKDDTTPADAYQSIAKTEDFPLATKKWITKLNKEMCEFLNLASNKRLFIRDLVPFHSSSFGSLDFSKCSTYINDFFDQATETSFNSLVYKKGMWGCGKRKKKTILFARGSAWKKDNALVAVDWKKIKSLGCNGTLYRKHFLKHEVNLIVISEVKHGGPLPFSIYESIVMDKKMID